MTPAPFSRLQASATRTSRVLVIRRSTLILDVRVQMVEALSQLGECWRAFSGADGLGLSVQSGGIKLVYRCLPDVRQ